MIKEITDNLMRLLPFWHYNVERSIEQSNKGLTHESYYCLLALQKMGTMTMTEIAENLYLGKQQTTRIINGLFKRNLVIKQVDSTDKRKIYISISKVGTAYLYHRPLNVQNLQKKLEKNYTAAELKEFNEALSTILTMVKKLGE